MKPNLIKPIASSEEAWHAVSHQTRRATSQRTKSSERPQAAKAVHLDGLRRDQPSDTMRFAANARASSSDRTLSAEGRGGRVQFFLQRVAGGLYVEREDSPRRGLRTQQSVQFEDVEHFKRWCDNDPIRFEHPLLHVNLKRDADELWRSIDASEP